MKREVVVVHSLAYCVKTWKQYLPSGNNVNTDYCSNQIIIWLYWENGGQEGRVGCWSAEDNK